ncbi:MAG: cation diffusion facilitator family transporter [Pirellulaceae bacterium]
MAAGGSKLAVVSALIGNFFVLIAKTVGCVVTGSGAMLSEAIHSLADFLNQLLLLVGIVRSNRRPDVAFQYGYGAERYVWALISAVGIFFLGCGVTVYHGVSALIDPHPLHLDEYYGPAMGILLFSFIVEGIVLIMAIQAMRKKSQHLPFFQYLRTQADPAGVAVILEDTAACVGILIAVIAILLTKVTGHAYWDAIGSLTVGLLLGAIAIWLIQRNRELLVGAAMPPHLREQVLQILQQNPTVEEVVDLRSRILDTETYRVKADVRFDGQELAKKMEIDLEAAFEGIKTYEDFSRFISQYADDLIDLLADEIDDIEHEIREQVPEAQHLDLEAD